MYSIIPGCTDSNFVEYYDYVYNDTLKYQISGPVDTANQDNGSCVNEIILGCTDASYIEYDDTANVYNESDCITPLVTGCTLDSYLEFDSNANFGDTSVYCINLRVVGCMNPNYLEFNSEANDNDPSLCLNIILKVVLIVTAFNYNHRQI